MVKRERCPTKIGKGMAKMRRVRSGSNGKYQRAFSF